MNYDNHRPPRFSWSLSVACSDRRYGVVTAWCHAVQLGCGRADFCCGTDHLDEYELSLTGPRVRCRVSRKNLTDGVAVLGPVVFQYCGYKELVGNRCWDAMFVERETVREIVRMLKAQSWVCESASGLLIDWFHKVKPRSCKP